MNKSSHAKEKRLNYIEDNVYKCKRHSYQYNLDIEEKIDENMSQTIVDLCATVDIQLHRSDIELSHPLGSIKIKKHLQNSQNRTESKPLARVVIAMVHRQEVRKKLLI
ncbi:unnamed protein product, partial [Didymodactylos carnosus]